MMKLKRIFKFLSRLFVRLAHVFEHLTCDDVPSLDLSDVDYGYIDPSGLDSDDVDAIEPPGLDSLLSDDEEVL